MLISTLRRLHPPVRVKPERAAARVGAVIACAVLAAVLTFGAPARVSAARVTGTLAGTPQQPDTGRRLHFENRLTGDIYIAPIHDDGSFALNLPPGEYDLRAQHGVMVLSNIAVGDHDVSLGKFQEHPPNLIMRVLSWESLFPTLLTSPAPSAAYLFTIDPTVLPPETIARKAEATNPIPAPPAEELAPVEKSTPLGVNGEAMAPTGTMAPMHANGLAPMTLPAAQPGK